MNKWGWTALAWIALAGAVVLIIVLLGFIIWPKGASTLTSEERAALEKLMEDGDGVDLDFNEDFETDSDDEEVVESETQYGYKSTKKVKRQTITKEQVEEYEENNIPYSAPTEKDAPTQSVIIYDRDRVGEPIDVGSGWRVDSTYVAPRDFQIIRTYDSGNWTVEGSISGRLSDNQQVYQSPDIHKSPAPVIIQKKQPAAGKYCDINWDNNLVGFELIPAGSTRFIVDFHGCWITELKGEWSAPKEAGINVQPLICKWIGPDRYECERVHSWKNPLSGA